MQKWKLASLSAYFEKYPTEIWEARDKKTGKTQWEELEQLSNEGWELVSVTPIATGNYGNTHYLLYTFKRPLE